MSISSPISIEPGKPFHPCIILDNNQDKIILEHGMEAMNPFSYDVGDTIMGIQNEKEIIFRNLRNQECIAFDLDKSVGDSQDPMYPVVIVGDQDDEIEYSSERKKVIILILIIIIIMK